MERTFAAAAAPRRIWWLWLLTALTGAVALLMIYLTVQTAWGLRTLRYELTPTDLIIPFGFTQTVIPRSTIRTAWQVKVTHGSRLNGTSLPGLQEGHWRFPETGDIYLYSRSLSPLTVIETTEKTWGISPADPAAFTTAVNGGKTGVFLPVDPAAGPGWGWLALPGLGFLAALGVPGLLIYLVRAAPRTSYTLTESELCIRMAWKDLRIPYEQITTVRADSPKWVPMRLMGTSLPGLHWGSFTWPGLGRLRLYTTRIKPLVLIEAGGRLYGITPAEDAAFVLELQARLRR